MRAVFKTIKKYSRYNGRKAQLGVGTAITVIILISAIMIGGLIMTKMSAKTEAEVNKTGDTSAQQNLQDVKDTGWSALTMLALAGFVGAAIVILALLMSLIRRRGGGGGF